MRVNRIVPWTVAAGLLMALGACEGIKKDLGMGKQDAPDEFRVVSRAPLSLPPDFTLRPPEPGLARPQEGTATQQARTAVFRADDGELSVDEAMPDDGRSRGERALLVQAGAGNSGKSDIRQLIDDETAQINADNEDFIDNLVFWREKEKPGEIIDAEAEAARLRENAALNRSPTTGATPSIQRKKKAILEGIF